MRARVGPFESLLPNPPQPFFFVGPHGKGSRKIIKRKLPCRSQPMKILAKDLFWTRRLGLARHRLIVLAVLGSHRDAHVFVGSLGEEPVPAINTPLNVACSDRMAA